MRHFNLYTHNKICVDKGTGNTSRVKATDENFQLKLSIGSQPYKFNFWRKNNTSAHWTFVVEKCWS